MPIPLPRHWKTPCHPCCLVHDYSEVLDIPSKDKTTLSTVELQIESSLGSFMSSSEGMPSKTKLSMWVACWESSWLTKTGSTGPEEEELVPSLSSCLRKVSAEPRQYSPSCLRLSPLPCLFRACRKKVSESESLFY